MSVFLLTCLFAVALLVYLPGMIVRAEDGVTNIEITTVTRMPDGVGLVVSLPAGFTNPVEVFRCSTLTNLQWSLAATNLATLGTNRVAWSDVDTIPRAQYYRIGSGGDGDSDGLADGREVLLYHCDPSKTDTDGDTLSDGQEVNVYFTSPKSSDTDKDGLDDNQEVETRTDPNNDDTNSPVVAILFPTNNQHWICIP